MEVTCDKQDEDCKMADTSREKFRIIAEPSQVIRCHEQVMDIGGVTVYLSLVTMKRSFLLVIDTTSIEHHNIPLKQNDEADRERMIKGFMGSNSSLKGLSLAIGEHNTCLINSETSLASATLASRLSRKLNQNRPVYVANNFQPAHDMIDSDALISKLYLKVFAFVKSNYNPSN